MEPLVATPQPSLSGVARVLVQSGKLSSRAAEDLARSARERKISFIGAVIASGAVKVAINQRYALKDAAKAHDALTSKQTTGATILTP